MEVVLQRHKQDEKGTMGWLHIEGEKAIATLELPWANNEVKKSCIPVGRYLVKRTLSPKFGRTFEITGVPDRSKILFHWGNLINHTQGCVLLGTGHGMHQSFYSIFASLRAFEVFMKALKGVDEFWLEVKPPEVKPS